MVTAEESTIIGVPIVWSGVYDSVHLGTSSLDEHRFGGLPNNGNRYEIIDRELFVTRALHLGHQHVAWADLCRIIVLVTSNRCG